MFNYFDSEVYLGFNLFLCCNFVDGISGFIYFKINGSKGFMNIGWNDVIVECNCIVYSDDFFLDVKEKEIGVCSDCK